jgi:ribonuclease HII
VSNGTTCGVDETGRGSGVGEIYCCAVILNDSLEIVGLTDSKLLSAKKRETLAVEIKEKAVAWSLATASLDEIIEFNVLGATLRAMTRAVEGLSVQPGLVLVDGNQPPALSIPLRTIVQGDLTVPAISAASIIAKVTRDQKMLELHAEYPVYGFDKHKGYLTKAHLDALNRYGPCPAHRITYAPIRKLLDNDQGSLF